MRLHFAQILFLVSVCHFAPAAETVSPWGIATSASGTKDLKTWMPPLRKAGASIARFFPEWQSIEPKKGEWHWERTDVLVETSKQERFEVNGVLMGSVPWSKEKIHTFPMSDLDGWSEFVSESVARYKSNIHYWEVWNEGNGGFNSGHHTAVDYAKLASVTFAAAKKVDQNAKIGLTTASFDPDYLYHTILAQKTAGTPGNFDYLCIHPYELADNVIHRDGEIPYLWMTQILRESLRQSAPEKVGTPIWITEVGRNIAHRKDQALAEREAASALVKMYVMALAQGISCVQWFEAQDPAGEEPGFGLLKRDGKPRDTHHAFEAMTTTLGANPQYLGWLALGDGGRGYGFVFKREKGAVLVAWKSAGDAELKLSFPEAAHTRSILGDEPGLIHEQKEVGLTDEPIYIGSIPKKWEAEAAGNHDRSFPWGGEFSNAASIKCQLGSNDHGTGIYQASAQKLPKVLFADGTSGVLLKANQSIQFFLHPTFATIFDREFEVTIKVRRVTPGNVGMNLLYERADAQGAMPYKKQGTWFSLGNDEGWQKYTWRVKDACFAKMWGYDIGFTPEQSLPFVFGEIEVSKAKPTTGARSL